MVGVGVTVVLKLDVNGCLLLSNLELCHVKTQDSFCCLYAG